MPDQVYVVTPGGRVVSVTPDVAEKSSYRQATPEEVTAAGLARAEEERYGGPLGAAVAGIEEFASGATGGAYDVLGRALYGKKFTEPRRKQREHHPVVGTVANVAGAAVGLGKALGPAGKAAGRLIGGGARGALAAGVVEGAGYGVGGAASDLALDDEPLSVERVVGELSSAALFGGAVGGATSLAGKALEKGLGRARTAIERAATAGPGEEGATLVADLAAHRSAGKDSKLFLATKWAKAEGGPREVREVGKVALEADRGIDRALRNPKALAENPRRALSLLQQEEHALESLQAASEAVRASAAGRGDAARVAALEAAPAQLEQNRALQERARALVEASAPRPPGVLHGAVGGTAYGAAADVIRALPIPFAGALAPILGGKISQVVADLVTGRAGKAAGEAARRTARAVDAFLDVGAKAAPAARRAAVPLATKVLENVSYGTEPLEPVPDRGAPKTDRLLRAYRAREREIYGQVQAGPPRPDGSPGPLEMRRPARERLATALRPVAAVDPLAADQLETVAARRVTFLAAKLPKRPDAYAHVRAGPDRWRPSDLQIRAFARYAAAVEDPGAVEERMADGTATPEDAEAYREVYPERLAHLRETVLARLPELRAALPYQRRLSLSIVTGVPVDPALRPDVLRVLQSSHTGEPGTEGGTQAPLASPQFASVSKEEPTPAQELR